MRVALESNRTFFYNAARYVDLKEKMEQKIEQLKHEGKSVAEENAKLKNLTKIANLLTPLSKYLLSESANKITYDALQIHGGTGYMKEFKIERLARDARITNIYEGTSQLQIVAASGGVINDVLADFFDEKEKHEYKAGLSRLANILTEIREIYKNSLKYILDKKDISFQDAASKELVELYAFIYIGYLLLDEAEIEPRKIFIANRYIINSLASARKNAETIKSELFSDILHMEKILV
jgi:3-(methylthio)propanoyl-CoA dehydrogenase